MLFSVNLLDGGVENVSLSDKHAKGRSLLEEVCRRVKLTAEMDYFGLKYCNKTGQESWLNLRNDIRKQMGKCNIYRLNLRVKYFVNQNDIILDKTRHQLFLNVRHNYLLGQYILSRDKLLRFHALLLRSEHGENALTAVNNHPLIVEEWYSSESGDALDGLRAEHARLKGVSKEEAEKLLVTEMEITEPTYGAESFHATNEYQDHVIIVVCRDAVRVYGNDKALIDEYDYESGVYPSTKGNNFYIEVQEDYRCYKITYKLDTATAARNLHRTTVEFCTFFTHESVSDWVRDSKQHTSSLKTFTSLIKHRIVDKKYKRPRIYKYDVIKTAREVFENAWRYVADEKAKAIQLTNGHHTPRTDGRVFRFEPDTPRTPKLDKLVFTYGSDGPKTPGPYKKAFKCGQATPRTPRLDRQVFQFGPATPRLDQLRPDSKQAFQFGPGTPKPDKQVFKFEKQVFQFGPVTPRLENPVITLIPATPRTPKPDKQASQFLEPDKLTPDKQVFHQESAIQRTDALNPDQSAFDFEPALSSTVISDGPHSISTPNFLRPPPLHYMRQDDHVESPGDTSDASEIASNLKLSPLAKKQKQIFKERFLCKVCKREYKTCAFVPCGHVVTCWGCAISCNTCSDCNGVVESVKPVKYP